MKKFTKTALIVCAVCLVLGLILVVIGSAFGARSVGREYLNDVLELDDLDDVLEDHHEPHEKIETKAWDYDKTFEEPIRSVDISMNFSQVDIEIHDQESIRVVAKNAGEHLRCSVNGSGLGDFR